MRSASTRILAAAGIAAAVVWAGAVIYCGSSRPGYNPVTQFVSELAERGCSTETVMRITGFCLPGLLVLGFAALLLIRSAGRSVGVLLAIHGVGRITAGIFPCDPGCPMVSPSVSQAVHNASAMVNGVTLAAAAFFCSFRMWRIRRNGFASYSLVSAIGGTVFLALLFMDLTTRSYVGLYQRLAFGIMHLWLAGFALLIWRSTSEATDRPTGASR